MPGCGRGAEGSRWSCQWSVAGVARRWPSGQKVAARVRHRGRQPVPPGVGHSGDDWSSLRWRGSRWEPAVGERRNDAGPGGGL